MRKVLWYVGTPFRFLMWIAVYLIGGMLGEGEEDAIQLRKGIWKRDPSL